MDSSCRKKYNPRYIVNRKGKQQDFGGKFEGMVVQT